MVLFLIPGLFDEFKGQQHLFKIKISCNIINVFSVAFSQFNASLLNKSKNLFKKRKQTLLISNF